MQDDDILEFADDALQEVSAIALQLAVDNGSALLSDLGTELFHIATHLDDPPVEARRIRKLLKDVERVCRGSKRAQREGFPCLEAIVYRKTETAESDVRQGLSAFLSRGAIAVNLFISHLKRFYQGRNSGQAEKAETESRALRSASYDYPDRLNTLIHSILSKYLKCTCDGLVREERAERSRHFAVLLLKPAYSCTPENQIPFELLISTTPVPKTHFLWQDIQLLVSRHHDSTEKRVMFADQVKPKPALQSELKCITRAKFCKFISQYFNARLKLMIQNQELMQVTVWEPRKQNVQPQPGTPLADILRNYDLSPRMKVTLAYIIVRSVWQFYGSDWMNTKWTSETIYFMSEAASDGAAGQATTARIFAWKPYFAAGFGEADPHFVEFSTADGAIHRYPIILALGIMLVEIGMGIPIRQAEDGLDSQSLTAKLNGDWSSATRYAKSEVARNSLEFPVYWTAAEKCLQPDIFASAPLVGKPSEERLAISESQRKILYEEVVVPLEGLFHNTGWAKEISTTPAVEPRSKPREPSAPPPPQTKIVKQSVKDNKAEAKRRSDAEKWLNQIDGINQKLREGAAARSLPYKRVRIAVLDTGCDEDSPFFLLPGTRVKGWKDWVDPPSEKAQDSDGHGTHLVSLIARMAPEADIYVSRVAKNAESLLGASDIVAQAVAWADKEWKADIISMSFGYENNEKSIDRAISTAVLDRTRQILFFAAASNYGANTAEMFPARHVDVISIRGTNADGSFEDFNPPRRSDEGTVYGTLGLAVPGASPNSEGARAYKSGTSVATAIAAGLAGMMLEFVNARPHLPNFETIRAKLSTHHGMLTLFNSISTPTRNEKCNYVTPWRLQRADDQDRWAIVTEAMTRVAWW